MQTNDIKISKFISLVLRHQPELIGIQLDQNGWADVAVLIEKVNAHGIKIDQTILNHIVATNPKSDLLLTIHKIKFVQVRAIP